MPLIDYLFVLITVLECQNKGGVSSIDINKDGSRAITGMGSAGQVILWDLSSGGEISTIHLQRMGLIYQLPLDQMIKR